MKDTTFLMTKREKVCLKILAELIQSHSLLTAETGETLAPIEYARLVTRAVGLTDQMLIELKVAEEHNQMGRIK